MSYLGKKITVGKSLVGIDWFGWGHNWDLEGVAGMVCASHMYFWCQFFFFFLSFRAKPAEYGGSQIRTQIGTVAVAYATATAMQDPRQICNLQHNSRQRQIPNPLSKAKD